LIGSISPDAIVPGEPKARSDDVHSIRLGEQGRNAARPLIDQRPCGPPAKPFWRPP